MRTRLTAVVLITVLITSLSGQRVEAESWPMFHADSSHTGTVATLGPSITISSWGEPGVSGALTSGSSPVIFDGFVYVVDKQNQILRRGSITEFHDSESLDTEGAVTSSPAVGYGHVFVANNNGNLIAFDIGTLAKAWEFDGATDVMPSPILANDEVIFAHEDYVYALTAAAGETVWSFRTGDYYGAEGEYLYRQGGNDWQGEVYSSPALWGSFVVFGCDYTYVGDEGGWIYCIEDTEVGDGLAENLRWQAKRFTAIRGTASIVDGMVYIGDEDGVLMAYPLANPIDDWDNDANGVVDDENFPDWTYDTGTGSPIRGAPAVSGGYVVFATMDGHLFCLDTSGNLEWSDNPTSDFGTNSPIIAGSWIYIGSKDPSEPSMFCYNLYGDGGGGPDLLSQYTSTSSTYDNSASCVDGRLFTITANGYLRTFFGEGPPVVQEESPARHSEQVPVGSDIHVTFTVDTDPSTLNSSSVVVYGSYSGPHTGVISYDGLTRTCTFDSDSHFEHGEIITVVLTADIRSMTGLNMVSGYSWSFTTASSESDETFNENFNNIYNVVRHVVACDIDVDSHVDLVCALEESDVYVLWNDGNGTFGSSTAITNGIDDPKVVCAGDLSGDGLTDIAIADVKSGSDAAVVFINQSSRNLSKGGTYNVGTNPLGIVAADVDNDGHLDLMTANSDPKKVSVLINNGDGTFQTKVDYDVAGKPYAICAAHIDDDEYIDFAVACPVWGSDDDCIAICINRGDGTFRSYAQYAASNAEPYSIVAGDLDGDGSIDLATANTAYDGEGVGGASVFWNKGGTFDRTDIYLAGRRPGAITTGDFNGDGNADLATANLLTNTISVLWNNGPSDDIANQDYFNEGRVSEFSTTPGVRTICSAEFNEDGVLDLATGGEREAFGNGRVSIHTGNQFVVGGTRANMFQDNFPWDGTVTGTVRADMAYDVNKSAGEEIIPGDSVVITARDPDYGIGIDPHTGTGPAVYCYVSVLPAGQPSKTGERLSDDAARYPVVDSLLWSGTMWYCLRLDSVYAGDGSSTGAVPDKYCIDLNDNLFTPPDTISYFFSAVNSVGVTKYWSSMSGVTGAFTDIEPMEFTCLPANGLDYSNEFLFVNDSDDSYARVYFETVFDQLDITPDRYDVNASSSAVGNGLGSRVTDVYNQLISYYRCIIWCSGNNSIGTVGDGEGSEKSDDWTLLFNFMNQHPLAAGVYLSGNNLAEEWASQTGAGAVSFMSQYLGFSLVNGTHTHPDVVPELVRSPLAVGEPLSMFDHFPDPAGQMTVFGGPPEFARFDVIVPTGSAALEMSYAGAAGAVVSQITDNANSRPVAAVLSGFSFHNIADDEPTGVLDRADHLYDILAFFDYIATIPTSTKDVPQCVNSLSQNYPNPFNPTTAIKYSIKQPGHVSLKVYNVAGQLVKTLVDEEQTPIAGGFAVKWNGVNNAGSQVATGVYFYKLVTTDFTKTRKMVLLK